MKIFPQKLNLVACLIVSATSSAIFLCIFLNRSEAKSIHYDIDKNQFAGSASCKSCHKSIYETGIHTAHYLTSRPASKEYIKGSFDSGRNIFEYNKFVKIVLEKKSSNFFQTTLISGIPFESESFDIAVGSGRKGQTYLYWKENQLFQLPVSYYTALDSWCNSPGYSSNFSSFSRQINGQCLECHSTYAKAKVLPDKETLFDKGRMIYGIKCEKCHGPAAEHVAYFTANPHDTISKFIINAKFLSRAKRLDACALCHSGLRKEIKPPFSFAVGDKLDDFSSANYNTDSSAMLDVHGNQYGLLTSSRCFLKSPQMDCSSCHNVHVNEAGNTQLFSQRCISCHNETTHNTCTMKEQKGLVLSKNCIDCHMPLLPSGKIFLQLSDRQKSTPDFVRTHKIAVYAKETKDYIDKIKVSYK